MIDRAPNTYEQLRDEATGDGAEAWRAADRETSQLRALYASLGQDPKYTDEHKAEQAWAAYEAAEGKIAANKARAKELLQKRAVSNERQSLPFPDSETRITSDTSKIIAGQNEASRIVRKVDREDAKTANRKGGFKPDRLNALRSEYGRGLEAGGVQGGAICRGVLEAAEELGVDAHSVVDGFRKGYHREALERAQHSERLLQLIGGSTPEPPFARPGSRGRGSDFHTGQPKAFLMGGERAVEGPGPLSGRRRPWK